MSDEKQSPYDLKPSTQKEEKQPGVRGLNKRAISALGLILLVIIAGVFLANRKAQRQKAEQSANEAIKQIEQTVPTQKESSKRAKAKLKEANDRAMAQKRRADREAKARKQAEKLLQAYKTKPLEASQPMQSGPMQSGGPKVAGTKQAEDHWAKARENYKQQIAQKYYAERLQAYDERLQARRAKMFISGGGLSLTLNEKTSTKETVANKNLVTEADAVSAKTSAVARTVEVGTIIEVTLYTGLDSQLPGRVLGIVNKPVYNKTLTEIVIPSGSKVIGTYSAQTTFAQTRMQVVYDALLLPDGRTVALGKLPGVDLAGVTGYDAKVDQHLDKKLTASAIAALIGAGGAALNGPVNQLQIDPKQQALSGGLKPFQDTVSTIAAQYAKIKPTLRIDAGGRVGILVTKAIVVK